MGFNLCLLFQNYIARFGHGSAKLARQAQSKEKTLAKVSWALTVLTIFCCWAAQNA
jgi:preprotein translocase subunit SecG